MSQKDQYTYMQLCKRMLLGGACSICICMHVRVNCCMPTSVGMILRHIFAQIFLLIEADGALISGAWSQTCSLNIRIRQDIISCGVGKY